MKLPQTAAVDFAIIPPLKNHLSYAFHWIFTGTMILAVSVVVLLYASLRLETPNKSLHATYEDALP